MQCSWVCVVNSRSKVAQAFLPVMERLGTQTRMSVPPYMDAPKSPPPFSNGIHHARHTRPSRQPPRHPFLKNPLAKRAKFRQEKTRHLSLKHVGFRNKKFRNIFTCATLQTLREILTLFSVCSAYSVVESLLPFFAILASFARNLTRLFFKAPNTPLYGAERAARPP